jgi:CRP-like cAMP-binding protein
MLMNSVETEVPSSIYGLFEELKGKREYPCRMFRAPAGASVFEADAPADHVYLIEAGEVRIYQAGPGGNARLVEILGPGEWFGFASLAGLAGQGKQALAMTMSTIWSIPVQSVWQVLRNKPQHSEALVQDLSRKLHAAREDAGGLVFDDCNNRLVKTLVRFSRTAAASERDGQVVLRITHDQLAQAIGVARETVSLALTQFRLKGVLKTGRNQLIFDPVALADFACQLNGENASDDAPVHDSESTDANEAVRTV